MSNFVIRKNVKWLKKELNGDVSYISLENFAKRNNISVLSYSEGKELIKDLKAEEFTDKANSYFYNSTTMKVIFIRDNQVDKQFLLAHEIGHYLLNHCGKVLEERDANLVAGLLLSNKPNIMLKMSIVTVFLVSVGLCVYLGLREPISPVETEAEQTITAEQTNKTCVLTRTGDKYHLPSCYYVRDKSDLIEVTLEEAEKGGYEPCKVCIGE